MASLSTAAVTTMLLCSQCQGYFPSTEALGRHLLEHNMLRALKSDTQGTTEASPAFPPPPPAPFVPVSPYHQPPPPPTAPLASHSKQPFIGTTSTYMPGTVEFFDEAKCFGFLKRSTPGSPGGQAFFHISSCDVQTPLPKRGEQVMFLEKRGPKGMCATSVCRRNVNSATPAATTTRTAEPVENGLVHGVVTAYATEGGFGTIATLNGTLHFSIISCDVKRPPLTSGERVMVTETVGPKGPTAGVVCRITMAATPSAPTAQPPVAKYKVKKAKKPTTQAPGRKIDVKSTEQSSDALLAAVTRAMHMLMGSPRNATLRNASQQATPGARASAVRPPPLSAATRPGPLGVEQYQNMLRNLSGAEECEFYLPAAVAMLARTKPVEAANIRELDHETQSLMLQMALQDELELVRLNDVRAQAEIFDTATDLNFGYAALPSPVAATTRPPPPPPPTPIPEAPRTMYCGVCMEDEPIEDIFLVSGCEHSYCRETMRTFILGCLERQEVTPCCPHDGCDTVLSDVDLTQVLTAEEQDRYYDICLNIAAGSVPGLFKCLHEDCRGVAALPPTDPHFLCPLCPSERCVQCNTREWHEGLTCEQLRQRTQDNELHPEQLRQIYGANENVYQCGGCSYGPIERSGCANMATHHNEVAGRVRFSNACPRCGWFAADIAQWPRWNGQLHAAPPQAAE